jgi:hypothetical protein
MNRPTTVSNRLSARSWDTSDIVKVVVQPGFRGAKTRSRDSLCVSVDSNDLAIWAYELSSQDGHIAGTGAKVQHPLPWADAHFPKKSFGVRCETRSLPDQPVVLGT